MRSSKVEMSLLLYLLFMFYAYFSSFDTNKGLFMLGSSDADPLFSYYSNAGIRLINVIAWALDGLVLIVLMARLYIRSEEVLRRLTNVLLMIGVILPWIELYWGSTFYYGEVRLQQQLPFLVNNFGIIGSFLFSYTLISINFYERRMVLGGYAGGLIVLLGVVMGRFWRW